jgi:hypothetical protein
VDPQPKYVGMLGTALVLNRSYLMRIASHLPSAVISEVASELNIHEAMPLIREAWLLFQKAANISSFSSSIYLSLSSYPELFGTPAEINPDLPSHDMRWFIPRLIYACRKDHVAVIGLLFFSPYSVPPDRIIMDYLLIVAAGHGSLQTVKLLLECAGYAWFNHRLRINFGRELFNALELAVLGGYVEIVEVLFYSRHGGPLETMPTSKTILFRFLDIHDLILNLIPDVNSYCELLDSAVTDGNVGRIECLLFLTRYRVEFMSQDGAKERINAALVQALGTGDPKVVDFLLKHNRVACDSSGKIYLIHSR